MAISISIPFLLLSEYLARSLPGHSKVMTSKSTSTSFSAKVLSPPLVPPTTPEDGGTQTPIPFVDVGYAGGRFPFQCRIPEGINDHVLHDFRT